MKPKKLVMDAGYKTPNIARELNEDGVQAVFPYVRPKRSPSRENGYYNRDYVYVKEFDCFVCPEYETLTSSTTDRKGYSIYKSKKEVCKTCPKFERCINEGQKVKIRTRHIWKKYLEDCDAYRKTWLGKFEYQRRKETIERVFGIAKEHHGFRYTNMIGRAKMQMKAALTYTCLNLKKLANIVTKNEKLEVEMA